MAVDFATHFAADFEKIGFERPKETLAAFAMGLEAVGTKKDGSLTFEELLVGAHALALTVASMMHRFPTTKNVQARMRGLWASWAQDPKRFDDECRRPGRKFLRNRRSRIQREAEERERKRIEKEEREKQAAKDAETVPGRIVCPGGCAEAIQENPTRRNLWFVDEALRKMGLSSKCSICGKALLFEADETPIAGGVA